MASSNEGSAHDQVGINSEVASVVKEFTEPVGEDVVNFYDEETYSDYVRWNLSCHSDSIYIFL